MSEDARRHLGDRRFWQRVLYMLFCAIAYGVAEFVVAMIAIFQIVCVAVTGSINARLHRLGRNVGSYIFELLQFATFNSERVPFPFADWPDEAPGDSPWLRPEASPGAPPEPRPSADETTPPGNPTATDARDGSSSGPPR